MGSDPLFQFLLGMICFGLFLVPLAWVVSRIITVSHLIAKEEFQQRKKEKDRGHEPPEA